MNEHNLVHYERFLLEVLNVTETSNGDDQVICQLLKKNIDKLDDNFIEIFYNWSIHKISEVKKEKAELIARVINSFSNLINQFPLGSKVNNIEIGITGYQIALTIYNCTDYPEEWAMVQNNLGNAYTDRIRGDKSENIEQAISAYSDALKIYTYNDYCKNWADTQNNLGSAYSNRIKGNKEENLEKAISAYSNALKVRTHNQFKQDWAKTYTNLGNAYRDKIRGDEDQNIERAINIYSEILKVYVLPNCSQDREIWAIAQNNLGIAYGKKKTGQKEDNQENEINAYSSALQVLSFSESPQDWSDTQKNLGSAYSDRIKGNKKENLEKAISAYSDALKVRTRDRFPQKRAETLLNLGEVYKGLKQFSLAKSIFTDAIEIVDNLRDDIISGEESKRKYAEKWNTLFVRMVEICLILEKETEAIEYVERSKTRNLVESILNRDSETIFPPEVVVQLEQLRDEIASGQYQIQNSETKSPTVLVHHLQKLRQQYKKLQDQYLPVGSNFNVKLFQSTLDANTAVIEWYITYDKIIVFVIKSQGQKITVWQSQPEDRKTLFDWAKEYLNDYDRKQEQWENELEERLKKLAEILHVEEILNLIPENCDRLILIPHCFLHLFPIHALRIKESYLLDLFPKGVSYAPSCQLLQQVQLRQRSDFQSLFAIQTPTEDLYEEDLGAVAAIKKQFADPYVLKKSKATKAQIFSYDQSTKITTSHQELIKANSLFFFCHGYFNYNSPLDSGLQLADEVLTLADIITHLKLENCRLVTLDACETGITDISNTSDEYIGLPSGFLFAGSTNVVSSLWSVNATATALLMVKFYEELQNQGNIVLALNIAQRWLRDSTISVIREWIKKSQLDKVWQDDLDQKFLQIELQQGNIKYFQSPFFWSAFYAIGKGV